MNFPASEVQQSKPSGRARWNRSQGERRWLILAMCAIVAFGCYLERRTALRTAPMTDLGVFAYAAWAVRTGARLDAEAVFCRRKSQILHRIDVPGLRIR